MRCYVSPRRPLPSRPSWPPARGASPRLRGSASESRRSAGCLRPPAAPRSRPSAPTTPLGPTPSQPAHRPVRTDVVGENGGSSGGSWALTMGSNKARGVLSWRRASDGAVVLRAHAETREEAHRVPSLRSNASVMLGSASSHRRHPLAESCHPARLAWQPAGASAAISTHDLCAADLWTHDARRTTHTPALAVTVVVSACDFRTRHHL